MSDSTLGGPASRLAESVRRQDWFVVAVELLILITGVFLGIEASNWNSDRAFRAQEISYLTQLKGEILRNAKAVDYQIRYAERVVDGGTRALQHLEGGLACNVDCETLLIDYFHSSQVWGTGFTTATYEELVRLGLPTDPELRRSVEGFYLFVDGWALVNATAPVYRERVRGHLSPDASAILWGSCYDLVEGLYEVLTSACAHDLRELGVASMLEEIRGAPGLSEDLRYWIGQNVTALNFYPDMLAHADSAVSAIDAVLRSGGRAE